MIEKKKEGTKIDFFKEESHLIRKENVSIVKPTVNPLFDSRTGKFNIDNMIKFAKVMVGANDISEEANSKLKKQAVRLINIIDIGSKYGKVLQPAIIYIAITGVIANIYLIYKLIIWVL